VTRDEPPDGPLSTALRAAGLEVMHEPVLERRVATDAADEMAALGPDDWLVLTSPFAIDAVAAGPARIPRVAVVGESSRRAAEARGFRVEMVSSGSDAKSLFAELRQRVGSGRICYPRSSLAAPPQSWPGVELISPVLYATVRREFDSGVIGRVDAVAVASPSAVEAVGPVDLPFASIGPSTSAAVRKLGREPWLQAPQRSFDSLARAIAARADELPKT